MTGLEREISKMIYDRLRYASPKPGYWTEKDRVKFKEECDETATRIWALCYEQMVTTSNQKR